MKQNVYVMMTSVLIGRGVCIGGEIENENEKKTVSNRSLFDSDCL